MRDIKFRIFDPNTNDMIAAAVGIDKIYLYDFDGDNITEQEGLIIMQYTGLTDKNGKDIYEKDICTIWMGVKQDNPYVVEDLRELYLDMNHADSYYRITMIEVIGNIYETPELVKP